MNKRTSSGTTSDSNGHYSISIRYGDTLLIRMLGYLPILFFPEKKQDRATHYLRQSTVHLSGVNIVHYNFLGDSLRLREEYRREFNYRPPRWNEVYDFRGIVSVNIHNLYKVLSFEDKRRRKRLRKSLLAKEDDNFIDQRFTPEMVSKVTPLSGDSLALFMRRYRPDREFLEHASTYDILEYIRARYILFAKGSLKSQ